MSTIVTLSVTHDWTDEWELVLNHQGVEELLEMIEGYISTLHPSRVRKTHDGFGPISHSSEEAQPQEHQEPR